MITQEQLIHIVLTWAKADRAADERAAELHALYYAKSCRMMPIPDLELVEVENAVRAAQSALTAACVAADRAYSELCTAGQGYVDQVHAPSDATGTTPADWKVSDLLPDGGR